MDPVVSIDYDELLAAYWKSLTTKLRGFNAGADFLGYWVPEDDTGASLLGLVEAASQADVDSISVRVSPQTASKFDTSQLERQAAAYGLVNLNQEGSQLLFSVSQMSGWNSVREASPVYRKSLLASLAQIDKAQKELETVPEQLKLSASCQEFTLEVLVTPSTHQITAARFQGQGTTVQMALLASLCGLLPGLTVQEASDHAALRLELQLRDPSLSRPVAGIVSPENASSMFQLPIALSHQLLEKYRKAANYNSTEHCYYDSPRLEWRNLPEQERLLQIRAAVEQLAPSLSLLPSDIEVLKVDGDVKVTIRFQSAIGATARSHAMRRLEYALKHLLEKTIELYAEEMKDMNAIRRL